MTKRINVVPAAGGPYLILRRATCCRQWGGMFQTTPGGAAVWRMAT